MNLEREARLIAAASPRASSAPTGEFMKAVTLSVVSVMLGLSTPAFAACPTSPYNYNAASCNSRCAAASGTLTCTVAGASTASEVVVVSNYIAGIVNGDGGNDVIRGANASAGYTEVLNGDGAHDTVYGDGGDDTINGGTGNDTLIGGVGNDLMAGDDGDDTMTGGNGDDDMDRGNGNDIMGGGSGDDVMDGGEHRDLLCGGDQAGDELWDGDSSSTHVDRLWGIGGTLHCADTSTVVDSVSTRLGCTNTGLGSSTAPADCP